MTTLAATLLLSDASAIPQSGLSGWVADVMASLGLVGVAVILLLETVVPVLPSEIALPLAGFTASVPGNYNVVAVIVAATVGSVVGALLLYWLSRWFGRERTVWVLLKIPLVTERDVVRGEEWFARHGTAAVFFGRMVPGVRSLISVPAGVERMPVGPFLLWTTAGSLIWNTLWIVLGYLLGDNWEKVIQYADVLKYLVVAAIVAGLAWFVASHLRSRRRAA